MGKVQLVDVTPEQLDAEIDRIRKAGDTHLAIVPGPANAYSTNYCPEGFEGRAVYCLAGPLSDCTLRIAKCQSLTHLVISGHQLTDASVSVLVSRMTGLISLDIGNNQIGEEGAKAIAGNLKQLTSLSIRSNKIGKAGTEAIARGLIGLVSLDIVNNEIGNTGAKAIAAKLKQLTSLSIGFNKIGDAGAVAIASGLNGLISLHIGDNQIGEAGAKAIAAKLKQLTSLSIGSNKIGDAGAVAIASGLSGLTSLAIGDNQIGDAGAKAIAAKLKQLTSLWIWENDIGDAGAEAIASGLNGLTSLEIGRNQIGEAGAKAIAAKLKQLTSLGIWFNTIGDAGAEAIASGLNGLTSLEIGRNQIGEAGAKAIASNLTKLISLEVSDNQIGDAGVKALAKLHDLTTLNLSQNPVQDISSFAEKIKGGIPVIAIRYWSGVHGISVADCPMEIPPLEIVKQGPEAVRNYFIERDQQSSVRLYEAKVLIIGEGGAGKTSLLRRLYQPQMNMPEEDETTRGIDIHRHDFQGLHGGPFRLNVWDFGGQHIYHATHQFFLTKSSLYVLVDDTRKDDKCIHDESFKFWFEVVETLSEKSPLFIFQNQKGGRSKDLDLSGIRARFPNVLDVYSGNLEQAEATTQLRDAIQFQVQRLPHVGTEVPAKWAEIRRVVEELSLTKPFITQEEYFKIYADHLEFDRSKALFLSRYLHDLGVFLHFQDDLLLRKTVILQNQWATDAVFRVLDDEQTKQSNGKFSIEDCSRLWHEAKYMDMHAELIGLMKKFELCYQLPETGKELWLAPQLLPVSKPSEISGWAQASDLVIRFKYSFLPRGLVSRLMVRQHRFVKHLDRCWTHGAFFEHQSGNGQFSQVLVEETLRGNEIELRARGPERKELLSVLVTDLEALNDSFEGLRGRVQKLVPCDCTTCSQTTDPHMYRYDELVGRKAARRQSIGCSRDPYDDVDVIRLLDGITVERLPAWADKPPQEKHLKIFLASSSELREDRDAFDLYFRQQNDSLRKLGVSLTIKRWENFLDAMSETRLQEEYNADVRNCDVFVCLIQTKAGKFTEEEFDVAFEQFKRTGRPKIYTYFKSGLVDLTKLNAADLASREAFQKKLGDLGHYTTEYSSIDNLKLQFADQLKLLLE